MDAATVVLVTYDPDAAAYSDRIVLLRDGRMVADRPTPDATAIRALLAGSAGALGGSPAPLVGGVR